MLIQSGILDRDETAIATDYGTNAEMALKVGDIIYTASTAAGPAIEGQQIEAGMLALPGAICDVVIDRSAGVIQNWVLDHNLLQVEGDTVDYISGEIIKKGQQKVVGLTGTGVIALLEEGLRTGLILRPNINTPNGVILYQKNDLGNKDDQIVIVVELVKQSPPVRFIGCTGCQQCEVSCPEKAITVDSGPDGFQVTLSYPHCYGLSCRKCETGCPEKVFSYLELISWGKREDGKK